MNTIELAKLDLMNYIDSIIDKVEPEHQENFKKCFSNTLHTTIEYHEDEGITDIMTGDIPAMWNRDSAAQIRPFLFFASKSEATKKIIRGIIKNYIRQIKLDPYANAFKVVGCSKEGHTDDLTDIKEGVWERKFEIDSLCYPIQLAYLYYKNTNDSSIFTNEFFEMMKVIVNTFIIEQDHSNSEYKFKRVNDWLLFDFPEKIKYETLPNGGLGKPTKKCGLIWSGFRPSDDACQLHYLIPSNMFAVVIMDYMLEINKLMYSRDQVFEDKVMQLRGDVETGIKNHALINDPEFGEVYAYEVDGYGNYLLMDDANVPSLLSLPYLGYCDESDELYNNTRNFILSSKNDYFYQGKYAEGIGSPHTPANYAWHIAIGIRGLSTSNIEEIDKCLEDYLTTDCGCGMYHEGFNVDDPKQFTREWFSWSNSIYVELVLKKAGMRLEA